MGFLNALFRYRMKWTQMKLMFDQFRFGTRDEVAKFRSQPVGDFKDARFLGSPVDLVVFDGLSEGRVRRIVFVEVKTGGAGLTGRERLVREVVRGGKVEWAELRVAPRASGARATRQRGSTRRASSSSRAARRAVWSASG